MGSKISFQVVLETSMDEAIAAFTEALKTEGFGVITRIDNHKVFKEKLGVDFRPYVILGICNPKLAYDVLNINPSVGLFLPCKATVEEVSDGVLISVVDPEVVLAAGNFKQDEIVKVFAPEAKERLLRVMELLRG
ncbi:MAG: DUF302 domain-containing protein [Anaerolineae bacterium]|jgi:uncharacterized protein (DUF302 family)|nr:DUF302 domain-containing protein [Anaerolineae bacterium]